MFLQIYKEEKDLKKMINKNFKGERRNIKIK